MALAASSATGKPTSASRASATSSGPPGATLADSAGARQNPRASPSATRAGGGTPASPKAGTKVTAGIARAKPSAQARGSTPLAANAAVSASSRLTGGGSDSIVIDAGARGALTVAPPRMALD